MHLENPQPRLFAFWTGDNPISQDRLDALETLKRTEMELCFITPANLQDWILPHTVLHPSYVYLSAIHRADYLRTYFMHHYGGGYSDLKQTRNSWLPHYRKLTESENYAVGYPEIGWRGVARVGLPQYLHLIWHRKKLIGNCAYIFRPHTPFTSEWFSLLTGQLDRLHDRLKKNPAIHPEDRAGRVVDGVSSNYPVKWSQLLGDIFHPLCLKYHSRMSRTLPAPSFARID